MRFSLALKKSFDFIDVSFFDNEPETWYMVPIQTDPSGLESAPLITGLATPKRAKSASFTEKQLLEKSN